jgi:hypothetical protein
MKHILVGVLVCKPPSYKLKLQSYTVHIQENARAADVLAYLKTHLKLFSDSWVLASATVPTTFFHEEECLHDKVENNDKLILLSSHDAARITFKHMFPQSFREGVTQ